MEHPEQTQPPTGSAKKPRKKHTRLRSDKERDMRSTLVLARRIQGRTMREIQDEFRISQATAYRALSHAYKAEFYEEARDTLLGLVPKAIRLIDASLDAGDVESAWKLLESNGLGGKTLTIQTAEPGSTTFAEFRARILTQSPGPVPAPLGQESRDLVDALVVASDVAESPTPSPCPAPDAGSLGDTASEPHPLGDRLEPSDRGLDRDPLGVPDPHPGDDE